MTNVELENKILKEAFGNFAKMLNYLELSLNLTKGKINQEEFEKELEVNSCKYETSERLKSQEELRLINAIADEFHNVISPLDKESVFGIPLRQLL